jgi:integrase
LAKRNYALLGLILETGLRVGEVAALLIGDLDLGVRAGLVRVREGKGRKQREVPLTSAARRALQMYLKSRESPHGDEYLFLSERGEKPLALRTIQATVSELARRARITRLHVSPHTIRHSFALRYLKGIPANWWNWPRCLAMSLWILPPYTLSPRPKNSPPAWRKEPGSGGCSAAKPLAPQRHCAAGRSG